ncbi:anthranilate phosphoribosyltransferase [Candidatus Saccharibacteria bacterium]|nr:anthranilate phosphoribosyltransferase [Candidatus Saccharibacteria bacterium]
MTIREFLEATISGKLSLEEQKKYLENNPFGTPQELAEAVRYLYRQMPEVPNLPGAIDICGTGGSGLDRINTSTISAFLLAALRVPVAKHGNNAASGRFGSFDLLAALDVPTNLSTGELQLRFRENDLAFLYARSFHPIMRHFAPVRAELSKPTFFNILGPLLSPINAKKQIIGTSNIENAKIIIEAAKELGKDRVIAVTGCDGLDDVTLSGPTNVFELKDGRIKEYILEPKDFGVKPIKSFTEISGGSADQNVEIALSILKGQDKSRKTDLVLVNTALALHLVDKTDDLKNAYRMAKQVLESQKAYETLEDYKKPSVLKKIIDQTKKRDFSKIKSLTHKPIKYKGGLIAEIKRKSPSEQNIVSDIDVVAQAKIYESAGAAAISVLTEPKYFGGSFDDIEKIREAVSIPILCKDFIISKEHIDAAKNSGADMILLIAAVLDEADLNRLYKYAQSVGLQVLVEVHNKSELKKVLPIKPKIVGINSRNLHDFSISPDIFSQLKSLIPKNTIVVAESGIENLRDIPKGADGALVGTVLMKHPFPSLKIKELRGKTLLKLCGIRSGEDAKLCEKLGVDMIGINFVPRSNRKVDIKTANKIVAQCKNPIPVGVFENQSPDEVNKIARETGVKAVQLSGDETDLKEYDLPIIKTIKLGQIKPKEAFLGIMDNEQPGSGRTFDHSKISENEPSLIAGGITVEIAKNLQIIKKPLGFDTASGIETDGQVDQAKIREFAKIIG